MPDYDYDRDDPTFVADLLTSRIAVEHVARWFLGRGHPVVINPTFVRPTAIEMDAYRDHGDLGVLLRIEVKRRAFTFTGRDDYPFATVIVDNCHLFDGARPKPFAYVTVSQDLAAGFLIEVARTQHAWTRRAFWDRTKKRERNVYECPVELTHAIRFTEEPS